MTLEDILLEMLGKAAVPLKAAEIVKQAKGVAGKLATPKAVKAALGSLTKAQVVSQIDVSAKLALYTTLIPEEAAVAMLRQAVQGAKKELEAAKLKAKLPVGLRDVFETALGQLVAGGNAFVLAGKKRLVYAQKPKPSALLSTAQHGALKKIFDALNSAQATSATLVDFVAWLDGEVAVEASPVAPAERVVPVPDGGLLREWYDLDRVRSSTVMIPIPQTFTHYAAWAQEHGGEADSQVLRSVMEGLYNEGYILLEPCEKPQDLPENERAMLVPMALGPPGWSWCWVG